MSEYLISNPSDSYQFWKDELEMDKCEQRYEKYFESRDQHGLFCLIKDHGAHSLFILIGTSGAPSPEGKLGDERTSFRGHDSSQKEPC